MAKSTAAKPYKLMRDDARPIEFDGAEVAVAELDASGNRTRAAVYRTAGGKFISEYTKSGRFLEGGEYKWEVERAKVGSFDTLEEAAEWFRPGPITTMLLAKLQDQLKGERIE
jgi:hypothetical protein